MEHLTTELIAALTPDELDSLLDRGSPGRDSSYARKLVTVARADSAALDGLLADGVSCERVAELAAAGETDPHLELDMIGLCSELARRTPITTASERDSFDERFLAIQPT